MTGDSEHPRLPAGTWRCSASDCTFVVRDDDIPEADGVGFRLCIERITPDPPGMRGTPGD